MQFYFTKFALDKYDVYFQLNGDFKWIKENLDWSMKENGMGKTTKTVPA